VNTADDVRAVREAIVGCYFEDGRDRPRSLIEGAATLDRLEARVAGLEGRDEALVRIRNVLGPDHFGCGCPMCEGCRAEGAEALRIANEALGFVSRDPAGKSPDASACICRKGALCPACLAASEAIRPGGRG
jgi:hypothetical protein